MTLDILLGASLSFIIAAIAIIFTIVYHVLKSRRLPPGPRGVPILGYWPYLDNQTCHLQFEALKKRYGDVFSFTCTGTLYIHLGTIKAVQEAHVTKADCFSQRCTEFNLLGYLFDGGIIYANGEAWKSLREFFMQVFRQRLSLNNNALESLYDSSVAIVEDLKRQREKTVNIIELLMKRCNSIVRLTLFGNTGISEEELREINKYYSIVIASMIPSNTLASGKIARYLLLPFNAKFREGVKSQKNIEAIVYRMIEEHKSTYKEGHIRDIIDEFLKERSERRSRGDPTAEHFTDKALVASLIQFMGDGVLAIAAFITIMIKVLVDNPAEQGKIYKELVEVVGVNRQPTIDDRGKLVYLNAFIMEALRTSNLLVLFPNLQCTKETSLHGYRIPKGAVTVMNAWTAHFDPEVYEEPNKFNPYRFINRNGKRKEEPPIIFGVGRRSCIGESFTMTQVFLFLATIIKNFYLTLPYYFSDNSVEALLAGKLLINARLRCN